MYKVEVMLDMYFGVLGNIQFDERVLFNNNFLFFNYGDGINIYQFVSQVVVFYCICYFFILGLIDRKLQFFRSLCRFCKFYMEDIQKNKFK